MGIVKLGEWGVRAGYAGGQETCPYGGMDSGSGTRKDGWGKGWVGEFGRFANRPYGGMDLGGRNDGMGGLRGLPLLGRVALARM